eukprot:SM000012S25422  [mRNA]  locus=s12:1078304:1084705:+ [translate_table: standard]
MAESSAQGGGGGGGGGDEGVEIRVKTLGAEEYILRVDRRIAVHALKERIAAVANVPPPLQRLICKGKVLKDEQFLSDFGIDDGHTLHLVTRPVQALSQQPSPEQVHGDGPAILGGPPLNMPFPAVNMPFPAVVGNVPDLNQVLGTVLNSVGMAGYNTASVNGLVPPFGSAPAFQVNVGDNAMAANMWNLAQGSLQPLPPGPNGRPNATEHVLPQGFTQGANTLAREATSGQQQAVPEMTALATTLSYISTLAQAMQQQDGGQDGTRGNSGAAAAAACTEPSSTGQQNIAEDSASAGMQNGQAGAHQMGAVLRNARDLLVGSFATSLENLAANLEMECGTTSQPPSSTLQQNLLQMANRLQELVPLVLELSRMVQVLRIDFAQGQVNLQTTASAFISPTGPNPLIIQSLPRARPVNALQISEATPSQAGTFGQITHTGVIMAVDQDGNAQHNWHHLGHCLQGIAQQLELQDRYLQAENLANQQARAQAQQNLQAPPQQASLSQGSPANVNAGESTKDPPQASQQQLPSTEEEELDEEFVTLIGQTVERLAAQLRPDEQLAQSMSEPARQAAGAAPPEAGAQRSPPSLSSGQVPGSSERQKQLAGSSADRQQAQSGPSPATMGAIFDPLSDYVQRKGYHTDGGEPSDIGRQVVQMVPKVAKALELLGFKNLSDRGMLMQRPQPPHQAAHPSSASPSESQPAVEPVREIAREAEGQVHCNSIPLVGLGGGSDAGLMDDAHAAPNIADGDVKDSHVGADYQVQADGQHEVAAGLPSDSEALEPFAVATNQTPQAHSKPDGGS